MDSSYSFFYIINENDTGADMKGNLMSIEEVRGTLPDV